MSHLPRPSSSSPSSSSPSSSSTQACAACKYQRRKCAPDCILAPFFPHDRQRQFLNAHKLFGVSNITKIIKNLDPFDKEEAMRTIIFQSDVRSLDPVGGCYRIIRDLQRQIDYSRAELDMVLHHLAICKAQWADAAGVPQQPHHQFLLQQQHQPYDTDAFVRDFENDNNNINREAEEEVGVWGGMQDSVSSPSSMHLKQAGSIVNDFDDIKIDTSNQHQSKFEPEHHELLHPSEEDLLMLKEDPDQMRQAQDQELKGAVATLFAFPNCDTLA